MKLLQAEIQELGIAESNLPDYLQSLNHKKIRKTILRLNNVPFD